MSGKRVPPFQVPADPGLLGYLAGLIDGEGSVSIQVLPKKRMPRAQNDSHSLLVSIYNSDAVLMQWLQRLGGGMVPRTGSGLSRLPAYRWFVSGQNAVLLLQAVLPYLVIKRAHAELALEFWSACGQPGQRGVALADTVVSARRVFAEQMHVLNRDRLKAKAS